MRDDRHGRTARPDNDRRRRPSDGFRARSTARFLRLAEDALAGLPEPIAQALDDAELELRAVPIEGVTAVDGVPLATFTPSLHGQPARLTLYRRPLEARAETKADLITITRLAAGREVAAVTGLDFDDDWEA